ncbi:hypothetical protein CHU00_15280 [Sphingobacterium cellulitidis]|uniref:TlpA family protein disulfide reductase n=1 Tax=Sphingobacterium cellulitidis TaxID=1768011 RepID=UPI000B93D05A|nr:TlpA disulfide reductase family protein [Sphingobacterium cellulitidis]OYD44736.1 hypothetical protein CHU00_15280 [Sphingobacterium cellulitidis]
MKTLISLIIILSAILTGYSQTKKPDSSIPKPIEQWIKSELSKSKVKEIKDYGLDNFFKEDSVRIIGYIKGYKPENSSRYGMIYHGNLITNEESPTLVRISPDGRFETQILLKFPLHSFMILFNKFYNFYVEPGNTLAMIIDPSVENEKEAIQFLGNTQQINKEIASIALPDIPYDSLLTRIKTLSEQKFVELNNKEWEEEKSRVQSIFAKEKYSAKAKKVLLNNIDLYYLDKLFTFEMNRNYYAEQDSNNAVLQVPLSASYFDFINKIDMNDHTYLIGREFNFTINRIEFSPIFPLREFINEKNAYQKLDSVGMARYKSKELPLFYNIAKVRAISGELLRSIGNQERAEKNLIDAKMNLHQAFLISELESVIAKKDKNKDGYELPKTESAAIFKKLMEPYKGKIVVVDFWAENCGPCRANIEHTKDLRNQLKDHPNLEFVFITDVGNTGKKFYDGYIKENYMDNSFLVSEDDYLAFRELFRFNGIPRYVLMDENGKIRNEDFPMHNLAYYMSSNYPEKFKREDFEVKKKTE